MDVYEAVSRRRSIRRFKDIAVPYDVLEKCVDAGRLAPTGRNRQLYEYIIVDDARLLPLVFDCMVMWAGQPSSVSAPPPGHRPAAYIITLINRALRTELGGSSRSIDIDIGMSAENMILVGLEQGIGACPMGAFQESLLRQALNITEKYEVALVLVLGYPDESPVLEISTGPIEYWTDSQGIRHVPKRKLEDIVHRNKCQ